MLQVIARCSRANRSLRLGLMVGAPTLCAQCNTFDDPPQRGGASAGGAPIALTPTPNFGTAQSPPIVSQLPGAPTPTTVSTPSASHSAASTPFSVSSEPELTSYTVTEPSTALGTAGADSSDGVGRGSSASASDSGASHSAEPPTDAPTAEVPDAGVDAGADSSL